MEHRDILGGVVVGVVVGLVIVGGLEGLVLGGLVGGLGVALNLKNQQEEQSQQLTHREESRQSVINPPSLPVQTPLVQKITKQFLVLVISATQAEYLKSLQAKGRIEMSDGERLYEITKYLWLCYETDFYQGEASINQYSVSEGKESEYDIYLVSIELNKPDKGFEPNVNQLDRYDAFRNLHNLADNFSISPRFQMEAYGNFEVYSR